MQPEESLKVNRVKASLERELLPLEGINGIGVARSTDGELFITVLVRSITPELLRMIPQRREDVEIKIKEVGEIRAL